ncbi:phytoene desaturase family protein [Melittangium boletus]|uniref:Amine oxidase flavin-containing n=1 Tax=Melittangium boletus DSM 14713 TaxID=1294270 RepID=A0A250I6B4_9BACT|nr:FAD-dependent oxidoreductase [Melittangium boletus]ATB27295.1 amine oxidase flavin-containing [Melittangium boletus DSM 14713]
MKATDVVVVGGGLGGLAVAALLARGGRRVVLFEKARHLGGRAHTTSQEGYHFNLGPHALFLAGAAARVLARLGLELKGRGPRGEGGFALRRGRLHTLPTGAVSLLTTDLLGAAGKLEFARVLAGLNRVDASTLVGVSLEQWLRANVSRAEVRELVAMLFRASTYCADTELMGADAAVAQHQTVLARGVRYLDGGWIELVRGLTAVADAAGVQRVISARVESVTREEEGSGRSRVRGVRLADGTEWAAEAVVVAGGPGDVASLLPGDAVAAGWAARAVAVKAASLEVGLSRLPRPEALVAFGVDRPWYASVHSAWARLAPEGGALVHVAKYLGGRDTEASELELEGILDVLQPGWRMQVVTRRFLPGLTVMHALPTAAGLGARPRPVVEHVRGLAVVGDWVGPEGLLTDASLASAEAVALAWLGAREVRAA